jgi:hypothetical protein
MSQTFRVPALFVLLFVLLSLSTMSDSIGGLRGAEAETAVLKVRTGDCSVYTDTVYVPYTAWPLLEYSWWLNDNWVEPYGYAWPYFSPIPLSAEARVVPDWSWYYSYLSAYCPEIPAPGSNTIIFIADCPCVMGSETFSTSGAGTFNAIQLTNTTTLTNSNGYYSETTTTSTASSVTAARGENVSFDVDPNIHGPNEAYIWSGPSDMVTSGGLCSFTPQTPGTYQIACTYLWNEYDSGWWDWEETIPYDENADGSPREVPWYFLSVYFTITVPEEPHIWYIPGEAPSGNITYNGLRRKTT